MRGIRRSPTQWRQWRRALMFSLICVRTNGWINYREAGDLRHHRAHYDVNIMPRQNGLHFADDIFQCIFTNKKAWILIQISLKFVLEAPIDKKWACRGSGNGLAPNTWINADPIPWRICATLVGNKINTSSIENTVHVTTVLPFWCWNIRLYRHFLSFLGIDDTWWRHQLEPFPSY